MTYDLQPTTISQCYLTNKMRTDAKPYSAVKICFSWCVCDGQMKRKQRSDAALKEDADRQRGLTCVAGHLLLGRMGLMGEALMLLSMLRRVLAVLRVLGRMWCVLLWVLGVLGVLPVLGVRSVLGVLWVRTVLAVLGVLAVLVVGAAVLREVLCVG